MKNPFNKKKSKAMNNIRVSGLYILLWLSWAAANFIAAHIRKSRATA
jgi:hypothetical protein